ncbi:hypothetical protein KDA_67410 [Dictyobacter alpinus]|uniref:Uncharacterized protein n=1 Tax=Dictyobacter alpinus TaxID=2014873 RepID=A0A402BJ06_9CHLR|nr:hypothetical protein [Dictyobacter alpinus]GCE31257.1 hypothetical protein KDA_67410 [Dictyobacter alpinus]
MSIICDFIGASRPEKRLNTEQMNLLIGDLISEVLVTYPFTIFVGDVLDSPEVFDYHDHIIPDIHPSWIMQEMEDCEDLSVITTLRYNGNNESSFVEVLQHLSFETENICIFFGFPVDGVHPLNYKRSWSGVMLFSLTKPYLIEYGALASSFQDTLSQFLVFYTTTGDIDQRLEPVIQPIIRRHFGPDYILGYASDYNVK